MATITGVTTPLTGDNPLSGQFHVWNSLAAGDDGKPFPFVDCADRTIQVEGTFGGGSLIFEGSNDGVNYRTLHDPQGVLLSIATAQIFTVTQVPKWIRPRVSGGDVTTALSVSMVARRTNR